MWPLKFHCVILLLCLTGPIYNVVSLEKLWPLCKWLWRIVTTFSKEQLLDQINLTRRGKSTMAFLCLIWLHCSFLVKCRMSHLTVLSWFWSNKMAPRSLKLMDQYLPFRPWKSLLLMPGDSSVWVVTGMFSLLNNSNPAGLWMKRLFQTRQRNRVFKWNIGFSYLFILMVLITTVLTCRWSKI